MLNMYVAYSDTVAVSNTNFIQRDAFEGWSYTDVVITTFGQFQKPDPNCAGAAVDMGHYEVDDLPADGGTAHDRMQTQVNFKRHSSSDPYVDCKTSASGEHVEVDEEVVDDEVEPEEVSDDEDDNEQADTPLAENVFPGESSSAVGQKARGQISAYAAMTMSLMFCGHGGCRGWLCSLGSMGSSRVDCHQSFQVHRGTRSPDSLRVLFALCSAHAYPTRIRPHSHARR